MQIHINGKPVELEGSISVTELLVLQKVQTPEYVTVELNGEILNRENFLATAVNEGDVVEFLYFMGGGA